jgi:hypothetical protein
MIKIAEPNTLGYLNPNDKFKFEGSEENYYFITHQINGFYIWDDRKKQTIILNPKTETEYNKLKIIKLK